MIEHRPYTTSSMSDVKLLNKYTNIMNRILPQKFTDAKIDKMIYIETRKIEFNARKQPRMFGRVVSGDWDIQDEGGVARLRYKSIKNHFENNTPWRETDYYNMWEQKVSNNSDNWRGFDKPEMINDYFTKIDKLYDNIRDNGYLTQRYLLAQDGVSTTRANNDAVHPLLNEVGVNIGRDGQYIFSQGGLHRLSIAKVLEISQIPVSVRVRHSDWQKIRNLGPSHEEFAEHTDHPDLQDLIG